MAIQIQIKKGRDGPNSLVCIRADGSRTIHRQSDEFFAFHDLTHYAVETVLSEHRGFFSLVAEGWNITDFGTPWPRGPMPADAVLPELIVGLLDIERATGVVQTPAEFNAGLATPIKVNETQLGEIRRRVRELHERWRGLGRGETIELSFPE